MLNPIAMSESIDLGAYFDRIGYEGPREPTLEVLGRLHGLHPRAIPFENLDVLLGKGVRIDLASLQAKLVTGRRGGYCFEHNTLFAAVLAALGFDVTGLAARVLWNRADPSPPRTHMLLRVELPEGPYLADVGFGGFVKTAPLRFEAGPEQDTGHGVFRLVEADGQMRLDARLPERWEPMYRFEPLAQHPIDYALANWYVSTHPDSPFVANLMAAWVGEDRRYGLFNNQLSIHHRGGPSEKQVLDAAGLDAMLHDTFGLARPADAAATAALYQRLAAYAP